jgi:hypothetical protein
MTNIPTNIPTFSTAAAAWFEDHSRYIKPSTADSYGGAVEMNAARVIPEGCGFPNGHCGKDLHSRCR